MSRRNSGYFVSHPVRTMLNKRKDDGREVSPPILGDVVAGQIVIYSKGCQT